MNVMGITNCFLDGFKFHSIGRSLGLLTVNLANSLAHSWKAHRPRGEPPIIMLNEYSIKLLLNIYPRTHKLVWLSDLPHQGSFLVQWSHWGGQERTQRWKWVWVDLGRVKRRNGVDMMYI